MDPPPGLMTDSDSCYSDGSESDSSDTPWEDEYNDKDLVSATLTKIKNAKKKRQSKTKPKSNVEVEGVGTKAASLRQESEPKQAKYVKKKCRKKGKDYARNYTFASKMQCLDHSIIEEFLASSVCGCKKKESVRNVW